MMERIKHFFGKSNIDTLENKLKKLCKSKEGFVVSLVGEWGIGKTFYWKYFVKKYLHKKNTAYVSLFGKTSLDEIRTEIVLQVSEREKAIKDFTKAMGTSRFFGLNISALASSFGEEIYNGMIICFDDFERLSDKLSMKDIMGLISELKENKNCKIILIMNNKKITDREEMFYFKKINENSDGLVSIDVVAEADDAKIYKDYKEKVIDYEFNYNPDIKDSFNLIKKDILEFEDIIFQYLKKHNIRNIRIMKKIVRAVNDFHFIKKELNGCPELEEEIIGLIIGMSTVYALKDFCEFKQLSQYTQTRLLREGTANNDKYEKILNLLGIENYFTYNELVEKIESYLSTSLVDKKSFIIYLKEKVANCKDLNMTKIVKEEYFRYIYDFSYGSDEFSKIFFDILHSQKEKIVQLLSVDSFFFYMEYLKKISPDNIKEYTEFELEAFKAYLDSNALRLIKEHSFGRDDLDRIRRFDPLLSEHLDKLIIDDNKVIRSNVQDVIRLMREPRENNGWGQEHETILSSISPEEYKGFLISSSEFVKTAFDFLRFVKTLDSFSGAKDNIVKAFELIYSEGDGDAKSKIKSMFNSLDIESPIINSNDGEI